MGWLTPKTDWIKEDYYNFGDLNRVENDTNEIALLMAQVLMNPILEAIVTNRDNTFIEFNDSLNRVERNILALMNASYEPPGWLIPKTDWVSLTSFDYKAANRLESNLLAIYYLINNIIASFRYSGTFCAGQDISL